MIKLKDKVNKSEVMRQLRIESERIYANDYERQLQNKAFINGAENLFKKLCKEVKK